MYTALTCTLLKSPKSICKPAFNIPARECYKFNVVQDSKAVVCNSFLGLNLSLLNLQIWFWY